MHPSSPWVLAHQPACSELAGSRPSVLLDHSVGTGHARRGETLVALPSRSALFASPPQGLLQFRKGLMWKKTFRKATP